MMVEKKGDLYDEMFERGKEEFPKYFPIYCKNEVK